MAKSAAVLAVAAAVLLAALPAASAQAAAGAAAGNAAALAGAGFPFGFPFFPFGFPFCSAGVTVSPWKPPSQIVNPGAGLLSSLNGAPVFSDVSLCCGGTLVLNWAGQGTHGVWQLPGGACPPAFNSSFGRQLFAANPAVTSATMTLNQPGTYWLTSQAGNDCAQGQLLKVVVPLSAGCPGGGTSAASFAGGPEQRTSAGPGSQASAAGPPGGTSTSANNGSAAAASGAPGQQFTATGPGMSYSQSGGRRLRGAAAEGALA